MKYKDTIEIKPYISSVWLITYADGVKEITIWHKDAKIEDVINATKTFHPHTYFTVMNINVGSFTVIEPISYMGNGREVDSNMDVII